jgi:hypothetical protein
MSNGAGAPVTGPVQTIVRRPGTRAWVALGVGAVATVLTLVGFYSTIISALDGGGSGPTVELAIFLAGIVLGLAAIVLAIVTLVRDGRRLVPVIAIAVALIPALVIAWLAISVRL